MTSGYLERPLRRLEDVRREIGTDSKETRHRPGDAEGETAKAGQSR